MKPSLSPLARVVLLAICWLGLPGRTHGQVETVLHNFDDGSVVGDGYNPETSLVLGNDGDFYGTTPENIFKVTPQGVVTIVHTFVSDDAGNPIDRPVGLILASDGNFYGTTYDGGSTTTQESAGGGTVFKMTPQGVFTVLHSFGDGTVANDGLYPEAGVIEASDGNLYGTTSQGGTGSNQSGTVFQITKQGAVTIIHNFGDGNTAFDGATPIAPLVQGSDGNLYGTTQYGGAANKGTVFETSPLGAFHTIHSFADGTVPNDGYYSSPLNFVYSTGALVQYSDGNFYGTTFAGGLTNTGTVFKITPQGAETILYSFDDNSISQVGIQPTAGLLLGRDGNFYGTTSAATPFNAGGTGLTGSVFQITPQGKVTFLHVFNDDSLPTIIGPAPDGAYPITNLIQGSDGSFYGTTYNGGSNALFYSGDNGYGTIYKLTLGPPNLTSAITASGAVANPFSYQITGTNTPTTFAVSPALPAGLSLNSSTGLITGTPTNAAVGTSTETVTLTNSGGSNTATITLTITPQTAPTITSLLYLYGTVTVPLSYAITATNSPTSYATSTFSGGLSGLSVNASTGVISGTPTIAGTYQVSVIAKNGFGQGVQTLNVTIFGTPPNLGQEYSILHRFQSGNDGKNPDSSLVQGIDGNFYGVTASGGTSSSGTEFNITPAGVVTILHSSGSSSLLADGTDPQNIVQGSDGNFYGTTYNGGTGSAVSQSSFFGQPTGGAIFKLTPGGSETILHNFGDGSVTNDGLSPSSALIQGADGNFYGTTSSGGAHSSGTVFQITLKGKLTILHSFGDPAVPNDGVSPEGNLIQGTDGFFYGTTKNGGSASSGTIFKITPAGAITILHSFGDSTATNDGLNPEAGLVLASDGNFYGTTDLGGSAGNGAVFKMTPQNVVTILHSFGDGSVTHDGANPQAALIQGFDGNLYGTTYAGGSASFGTVFEITTAGTVSILHHFGDGTIAQDGANPQAALFQGVDGNFYGTAFAGGVSGDGIVFTIVGTLAPAIPPTIIGATTVFAPVSNPLLFVAQALQSQSGTNGLSGSLVKAATQSASTSIFQKALAFLVPDALPADTTPPPTRWVLTGSQTPVVPPNLTFDATTGTTTGTPVATPGVYTFSIAPQNNFSAGTQRTVTMYIESAPTVTSAATDTATEGVPYSYQVSVADYDFPFVYSATHLPGWLSIDPIAGTLTGVPPGPGTYTFSPIANNLSGSTGLQVTLTVAATSPNAPKITSATSLNITVNAPFSYQIAANNSPTGFSALTLPPGLLFNSTTGVIFGTPTTSGSYSIPISATNASSTYASVLTLNISSSGAPVVTSSLSVTTVANHSFSYQITATGTPTSYGATGLPTGLSLNTMTGLITGTPTVTGTYPVGLAVGNALGSGGATLSLAVATPQTFGDWESSYHINSPPTAVTEPDGIAVLLKYLYDINPTAPMTASDLTGLPTPGTAMVSGVQDLTLTFREYSLETGLTINVQTSPDLHTWTTVPSPSIVPTGSDPVTGDPIMQAQVPLNASNKFIRLDVTSP